MRYVLILLAISACGNVDRAEVPASGRGVTWDASTICRMDDSVRVQVLNDGPATTAGLSIGHAPAKEEQVPTGAIVLSVPWAPCDPKVALDLVTGGTVVESTQIDRNITPECATN